MQHADASKRTLPFSLTSFTLLASAWLSSQGAMQLLGARCLPSSSSVALLPERVAFVVPAAETLEDVLQRNIFDHTTGPLPWTVKERHTSANQDINARDAEAPSCEPSLRLVASLVSWRDPQHSLVAITQRDTTSIVQPGMLLEGGHEVLAVHEQHVLLRARGRPTCQLGMFAARSGEHAPAPGIEPASSTGAALTKISDTRYELARSDLEQLLNEPASVLGLARVRPKIEGGQPQGMQLFAIRRGSLLAQLGLRNGDVLRTLNGYDLSSPDSALAAYAKLRAADELSLTLTRQGAALTIAVVVR